MPSGRIHLAIEAGLLVACTAGGALLVRQGSVTGSSLAAFASGFAFSMLLLSPDLDLARSRPARRWGPLSILWWPYARLFRHRGISHHMFWGPLTRLAYLALVVGAVAVGVGTAVDRPFRLGRWPADGWAALVGVYVPNVAHALVDALVRHRRRS